MRSIGVSFFLLTLSAFSQPISFGIRAGVPFTDAYEATTTTSGSEFVKTFSDSKEYVIGPMVELHLPLGFSVEADALYHPLSLAQQIGTGTTVFNNPTIIHSWEFPILAKYRFLHLPLVKPYVEGGPSFRAISASYFSNSGITLGAGVELKIARIRIEPELRYTRWGADAAAQIANGSPPSNINQAQFLVGLTF
jgi:hypothetical protein